MKSVFNKAAWIFILVLFGSAATGRAQVYFSVRGLLAEQFRQSELVDFERTQFSETDRKGLEKRLGQKLERGEYIFYVAHSGGRVDGYALFDREIGQHEYISFAAFFYW